MTKDRFCEIHIVQHPNRIVVSTKLPSILKEVDAHKTVLRSDFHSIDTRKMCRCNPLY